MGILSALFGSRTSRIEAQIEKNPAPELFAELVRLYQEEGNAKKAAEVAKRGISKFSNSKDLQRLQSDLERAARDAEKERLRAKIESYPNAILYARLAELYKKDGQIQESERVCKLGMSNFPEYGGNYIVMAEINLARNERDSALKHLEKAVEKDKYNYMALKLLAGLLEEKGKFAEAAKCLEQILYFAPGDEAIEGKLGEMRKRAGQAPPTPAAKAQAPAPARPKIAKETVRVTAAAAPARAQKAAEPATAGLGGAIGTFRKVEGVAGAILVDPYGLVVASDFAFDADEELIAAMVTNIHRSTAESAGSLGVGVFEDGLIESESGTLHVVGIKEMILAVLAAKKTKPGLLEQQIRAFAAEVLEAH